MPASTIGESCRCTFDAGPSFNAARRTGLYKQLLPRLEALPGVQSATLLYFSLLSNGSVSYTITAPVPARAPMTPSNAISWKWGRGTSRR